MKHNRQDTKKKHTNAMLIIQYNAKFIKFIFEAYMSSGKSISDSGNVPTMGTLRNSAKMTTLFTFKISIGKI